MKYDAMLKTNIKLKYLITQGHDVFVFIFTVEKRNIPQLTKFTKPNTIKEKAPYFFIVHTAPNANEKHGIKIYVINVTDIIITNTLQ